MAKEEGSGGGPRRSSKSTSQQQQARQQALNNNELLNFHFARTPAQQQQNQHRQQYPTRARSGSNHNRGGNSSNKYQEKQRRQQYHRTAEDRASARRKAANNMFPLHSSSEHAFVLTRSNNKRNNNTTEFSYSGPDQAVSWESVKLVKHLLDTSPDMTTLDCPICLDPMQCARITKCGHCFCLPCLIHHVQSFNNDSTTRSPKCPCCSIPLFLEDLRPVQLVHVRQPNSNNNQNQRAVFVKLHRYHASSTPYVPQLGYPRRGCVSHGAPTDVVDADAKFCRFNYVDPPSLQSLLEYNRSELLLLQQETYSSTLEELCLGMALQMVDHDLQRLAMEVENEVQLQEQFASSTSGMYQSHPKQLLYERKGRGSNIDISNTDDVAEGEHQQQAAMTGRDRGDSIVSAASAASSVTTSSTNLQGGSMYTELDEYVFYQAEDGSLCFLSGFNMNCLRTEYSEKLNCGSSMDPNTETSNDETATNEQQRPPLPDTIEGRVLKVERVHLTADVRQRRRFLSHLPLYSDVCFVELSLGHLLSNRTKKIFKKEFNSRNQARAKRLQAEKRADARERRKEEARINELKIRFQRIDPNDEFFQPVVVNSDPEPTALTGEDFGPAISSPSTPAATAASEDSAAAATSPSSDRPEMSFSQICRAGDAFPTLGSAHTDTNFPALGSSPPPPRRSAPPPRPWGNSVKTAPPAAEEATPPQVVSEVPLRPGEKRKKGKSKKIVLFSTGGHRGGAY